MPLVLEVVSAHAGGMGTNRRKVIGTEGARIGRDDTNDWVIADPYISGHHVTIRFVNGQYFVEGSGRNPIALNDPKRKLRKDDPCPLCDGDRLFIDEYELRVSIVDADMSLEPGQPAAESHTQEPMPTDAVPRTPRKARDPFDVLKIPAGHDVSTEHAVPGPKAEPISNHAYRPPSIRPTDSVAPTSPETLPDDWHGERRWSNQPVPDSHAETLRTPKLVDNCLEDEEFSPNGATQPHASAAQPRARTEASRADDLRRLLAAAGLDVQGMALAPDVPEQLGTVVQLVVQGTMDVLRALTLVKSEFRMQHTQIAQTDNNPLKFSANAADALQRLLVQRSEAYLPADAAFAEAFEDLRLHQLAMLKGIDSGLKSMLTQLDPSAHQKRVESEGTPGAARRLLGPGKAKMWDQYVSDFARLTQDPDHAFRRLFGDEFGRAYEEELRRLRTPRSRRAAKRQGEGS